MGDPPPRPRRGAWPWGLIGMLGLVAAAEASVRRHEDADFTTNIATSWRFSAHQAARRATKCEVLCFGDSMVKFGLLPRVIESRIGRSAYNLAAYAGPPAA